MLSDLIAKCWLVYWYCSVYGVEYHTSHLPTGGGCISLHTGRRCGIHNELAFMLTCIMRDFVCYFLMYLSKLWFPIIVLLGNEDYEYHECVILPSYYVLLNVILLLYLVLYFHCMLYTPVYSVPIHNVILKRITSA